MFVSAEVLFKVVNNVAVFGWLLLVIAPNRRVTALIVRNGALSITMSVLYLFLIVTYFFDTSGGFGSIDAVTALFENRYVLVAGWVHYLAFDLLVGCWEMQDAQRRGISHYLLIPSLLLTFMFGPAGFLLYVITRTLARKKSLD